MIPERRRAELPAGHPMVIDEDPETGRPVVILADWVKGRDTEQQLVSEALRWWRSSKRGGLSVVPIGIGTGAAWAAHQLKNPVVSALAATAVTAAAATALLPAWNHHTPSGTENAVAARPPAASGVPTPQPPKAVPVSHKTPKHPHRPKHHPHPAPKRSATHAHRGKSGTLPRVRGFVPPPHLHVPGLPPKSGENGTAPGTIVAAPVSCHRTLLGTRLTVGTLKICL
jgi:hypothetical protein